MQSFYKICLVLMIVGGINWACSNSISSAGCWGAARPSGRASSLRWWAWPQSAASRGCSVTTRPGSDPGLRTKQKGSRAVRNAARKPFLYRTGRSCQQEMMARTNLSTSDSHADRKECTKASVFYKKISHPIVCGNQTYPYGQVGALSPVSRFLIEPSWSTHDGEVCNPPENSKLPLID